ncbi:MAG TPA: 50S ribosomal protein L25 [Pirellulales bacterium]|jgi:large subunit ribosomal protein L25|nr:50S ribosomal protein L25 [Pirellulales bacterium]
MPEVLNVEKREPHGKREARRLRSAGAVPANLYGHGQENVALALRADEVGALVRHGARVVDLQGAVAEKAFIRDLQWDTYGTRVLHLDLTRISADERLQVKVSVELRGTAVGAKEGGIVEQVVHDVEIECLAIEIPEKLVLRVTDLQLEGSLTAADIELPPGVTLVSDPEELVVHCVKPSAEEEGEPVAGEGAEPEVIGRKAEDEGDEEA